MLNRETRGSARRTEHCWFDGSYRFYRVSLSKNTGAIDTVDRWLNCSCISGRHFDAEELGSLAGKFEFVFFELRGGVD